MPNRIIKESICTSKGLSECSLFAEDLYKRLIVYADDYGRFNADTEIMLARLYPRELQFITEDDIIDALIELAGIGKVAFYTSSMRKDVYGCLPRWDEHQRVRNVKSKCPDPDNTEVNDWYLKRYISAEMKEAIIKRDNFKCQICGKFVSNIRDAKRLMKLGSGTYHIDHIVPVIQGGRATLENLRLTCPSCNQSRKKRFTMSEIVDLPIMQQIAADCSELSQNVPVIQSNPNPNPNKNIKHKYGEYGNVLLTDDELEKLKARYPTSWQANIDKLDKGIELKGYKYKNHYLAILKWAKDDAPIVEMHTSVTGTDEIKRLLEAM